MGLLPSSRDRPWSGCALDSGAVPGFRFPHLNPEANVLSLTLFFRQGIAVYLALP